MIAKCRDRISAFLASVACVFTPPFRGLPFIIGCFFLLSYIAIPHNPVWSGDLPDPDDYTYLSQTLDWLTGQGWFDNIQHRMNPPEGVSIHYTRLAEMPIAAAIMLFRTFHYSWQGSAMLASFLLPLIYLGFLFAALRFTAARLGEPDWARLSSLIVLFAPAFMFKFAPGQVDHHGLEGILTIFAIGLTAQMFARPAQYKWALGAGAIFALANGIALETLPWQALATILVGLWCIFSGIQAKRATMSFAAGLFVVSAAMLLLQKSPSNFLQPDILAYSFTYVLLAAGMALVLLATAMFTRIKSLRIRVMTSGLVAFIIGGLYLWHYPALLGGPYGAMDPRLAQLFFSNLEEAQPLTERYTFFQGTLRMGTALIGLAAAINFTRHAKADKKWTWGLVTVFLVAALVLTVFYQVRLLIYATLFAVLPLTHLAEKGWTWIGNNYAGRKKFWAEIFLFLSIGPLTAVLLPALQDGRSFSAGILLFPGQIFDDSCGLHGLETLLDKPEYTVHAPLRIANMMDVGPELLFRTPHTVMSAPYHMNVSGNLDMLDFFRTTDIDIARQIAKHDHIDLVTLCRTIPDMYLDGPGPHYLSFPTGEMRMRPDGSLAGRLAFHRPPDWLVEVPVPSSSNYLLFQVK